MLPINLTETFWLQNIPFILDFEKIDSIPFLCIPGSYTFIWMVNLAKPVCLIQLPTPFHTSRLAKLALHVFSFVSTSNEIYSSVEFSPVLIYHSIYLSTNLQEKNLCRKYISLIPGTSIRTQGRPLVKPILIRNFCSFPSVTLMPLATGICHHLLLPTLPLLPSPLPSTRSCIPRKRLKCSWSLMTCKKSCI